MRKIFLITFLIFLLFSCSTTKREVVEESYSFHTDDMKLYLEDKKENFSLYAKGVEEKSVPKPIVLSDREESVLISENENLEDGKLYKGDEVYNLYLGKEYFYSLDGKKTLSFTTSSTPPRLIYTDGITNFRDLGGWSTMDGLSVKQGMLYRSSKFNKDNSDESLLSDKAKEIITHDLGIKTELDLRKTGENGNITKSPLGESVKYIHLPFKTGGRYLLNNTDKLPELFKILSDETNYPLVFHCSIGTDRTGVVAFLVNALLGVSEEDLYRDYLFSNFANIGGMRRTSALDDYLKTINTYQGDTLSERVKNFLLSYGVNEDDLKKVIDIMKD